MAISTSKPFPTIGMVSTRANELGMSYGTYSSSSQYKQDIICGWYEKHYTKSGRRKQANDRKADSGTDVQSENETDRNILPDDYLCGIV